MAQAPLGCGLQPECECVEGSAKREFANVPWYSSRGPRPEISLTPAEEYVHPTKVERKPHMNMNAEEHNRPLYDWSDEASDVQIRKEINARQLEEEAIIRQRAIAAHTPPRPVMPTPTASSPTLPVEHVAEYLNSEPRKTALALQHLAASRYALRVSVNPDRWVRVVSVEDPEPAPKRQMFQLGHNLRVPLDSVTLIDVDEEVAAAPPEPRRPRRVLSPEVERRLAIYGPLSPFGVLDVEHEILMEKIEAKLDAGQNDDEESPF